MRFLGLKASLMLGVDLRSKRPRLVGRLFDRERDL